MTEMQVFEDRFAKRLRAYAAQADRPTHGEALATAVAAGRERRRGVIGGLRLPTLQVLRLALVAALGLIVVVVALGVWGGGGPIGPGGPSPSPSPTSSPRPLPASVPLSTGSYLYDNSRFTSVAFTFTVPDGWAVQNGGWTVSIDQPDEVGFDSSVLDSINADACAQETKLVDAGSTVDDLVNALLDQSGPVVEGPFDVTLGGYPGKRLDVTTPVAADLARCNVPDALQLWRDQAGNHAVVFADWQTSIYIVDVGGKRVVLMTVHQKSSPASDVAELEAVIKSIRFAP